MTLCRIVSLAGCRLSLDLFSFYGTNICTATMLCSLHILSMISRTIFGTDCVSKAAKFFLNIDLHWQDFLTRPVSLVQKNIIMKQQTKTDKVKDQTKKSGEEVPKTPAEKKQQQSDPQITELKGFIDPQEELEVKGTDNPY